MMGADWVFIFVFMFFNEMGIICTNIAVKKRQEARVCSEMEFLYLCWGVRGLLRKRGLKIWALVKGDGNTLIPGSLAGNDQGPEHPERKPINPGNRFTEDGCRKTERALTWK